MSTFSEDDSESSTPEYTPVNDEVKCDRGGIKYGELTASGGWSVPTSTFYDVEEKQDDPVSHPSHYTQYPVEVIELTRHMSFGRGNCVKYVARAGFKGGPLKELEDLRKGRWYLDDEIAELEKKLKAQGLL
jgi:hypothetical protein